MVQAERRRVETGVFEVRLDLGLWRVMRTALLPLAVVVWIVDPFDGNVTVSSGVIGGALLLLNLAFWTQQLRLRSLGCLLRIDASGVTVAGEQTVPWRDLGKVEVIKGRIVAFVPRSADVALPVMPSGFRSRNPGRTRDRIAARFGTPLIVSTTAYNVRVDEIVEAVRTCSGGLPVFD